jgi:hypothetical protein
MPPPLPPAPPEELELDELELDELELDELELDELELDELEFDELELASDPPKPPEPPPPVVELVVSPSHPIQVVNSPQRANEIGTLLRDFLWGERCFFLAITNSSKLA